MTRHGASDGAPARSRRFSFFTSHICNQANKLLERGPRETLKEDRKIDSSELKRVCKWWGGGHVTAFLQNYGQLDNKAFQEKTGTFRNKFHHRSPPRLEFGVTQLINRNRQDGLVNYSLGGSAPLQLTNVVTALTAQFVVASKTFDNFRDLVTEQIELITAKDID